MFLEYSRASLHLLSTYKIVWQGYIVTHQLPTGTHIYTIHIQATAGTDMLL